jgi:hypothetical protein
MSTPRSGWPLGTRNRARDFLLLRAATEESGSLFSLLCPFNNSEGTFGTKLIPLMRLPLYCNKFLPSAIPTWQPCEIMRWEEHCSVQDFENMLVENIKRKIWPTDWLIAKLLLPLASTVIVGSWFHGTHELILLYDSCGSIQNCVNKIKELLNDLRIYGRIKQKQNMDHQHMYNSYYFFFKYAVFFLTARLINNTFVLSLYDIVLTAVAI